MNITPLFFLLCFGMPALSARSETSREPFDSFMAAYRRTTIPVVGQIEIGGRVVSSDVASGFFYRYESGPEVWVFLVTARHVVENASSLVLLRNHLPRPGKNTNSLIEETMIRLDTHGPRPWGVAKSSAVDVAVLLLERHESIGDFNKKRFELESKFISGASDRAPVDHSAIDFDRCMNTSELSSEDHLWDIVTLGYPLEIISQYKVEPIVRAGVISLPSLRGVPNFPSEAFLVEANVYPGSSGGPVVLRRRSLGEGKVMTYLAGVVSAFVPWSEDAYSRQTSALRVRFEQNSGLGIVFPCQYINEAIEDLMSGPGLKKPAKSKK